MKGVTFGNYHSFDDFSLIMRTKEIGNPEIKRKVIDVEGADGVLDYTDFWGEAKYSNRILKFVFSTIVDYSQFLSLYSTIMDAIHGKNLSIILDDDPSYYYMGRISVSPFTNEKVIGNISIECDCEPYKLKLNETVVTDTGQGSGTVILSNSRKKVVPTITATAPATFTFNGNTYSHGAGTFVIPQIELVEGSNSIGVYSANTATLTFRYREGKL